MYRNSLRNDVKVKRCVTVQPYTKYTKNLRFQTSLNSDFVTLCMAELLQQIPA